MKIREKSREDKKEKKRKKVKKSVKKSVQTVDKLFEKMVYYTSCHEERATSKNPKKVEKFFKKLRLFA